MTDIIVFCVGLLVSTLVVFGIFSKVTQEMGDSRRAGIAAFEADQE